MKQSVFFLVATILAILLLASCAKPELSGQAIKENTDSVSPEPKNPLVIGAIFPMTGNQASYGIMGRAGAEIAVEEINAAGGVYGQPLKVVIEDDNADPKKAVTAFQKLLSFDHIKVVMPGMSSPSLAVAAVAEPEQIITLAPLTATGKLSGKYAFKIREDGSNHGRALAKYSVDHGWMRAAVLSVETDAGAEYADSFQKDFEALGGKVLVHDTYEKDTSDFRTSIEKIKKERVDVICLYGYGKDMGDQLKQAEDLGLSAHWITNIGIEQPITLSIAGKAAEGVIYTAPKFDIESQDPLVKAFVENVKVRTNATENLWMAANVYDAVKVLAKSFEPCNGDTTCAAAELHKVQDFPGLGGSFTIGANGGVTKELMFKTIKDGKFVKLG